MGTTSGDGVKNAKSSCSGESSSRTSGNSSDNGSGASAASASSPPPPQSLPPLSTSSSSASPSAAAAPPPITEVSLSSPSRRLALFGSRALAAGSKGRSQASASFFSNTSSSSVPAQQGQQGLTAFGAHRGDIAAHIRPSSELSSQGKYLVVGDGMMAPFMTLCLRVHGLDCDLAHHVSGNDMDRGTIVLTPSVTQVMGDVLNVSVPSGSVVGRILTFDHVGNDMCDVDLNEFREKGESPTFFCCDRLKLERALLSLCEVGSHSCHVLPKPHIDRGGLEPLENGGVRVRFASGMHQDYLGVICTSRSQELVPELTLTNEELQQRAENAETFKEGLAKAVRWMELCVPPLPELGRFEKRFTPGSQEIVELLTPRDAKMTVRPTMMATKLFYNVTITIPDGTTDPRLKSTSTKQFWDDVIMHWTSGVPGYIPHTMFRPMMTHMQQHFTKSSALVYRTPLFLMPHWSEGGGRVIKVAHAAHGCAFDAIDVADAQGFTDCFGLARAVAEGDDVQQFLHNRRLQVMEELDYHALLLNYGVKERGQLAYMASRFAMKIMRRYKKSWRSILCNYVTLMLKVAK
ncbi:hypothetical protein TRSC58_05232 [Trypanosoma rangeli SC58]|uniref:Uncharacterized protein n=1 Tax=Trypanosoma rangeli SC58 TaxID=429131 RepID=A0A061IYF0_TRYRA|nr:hypothetical protein TRSC58_05232 [Trypanosoma rangeli SC58]